MFKTHLWLLLACCTTLILGSTTTLADPVSTNWVTFINSAPYDIDITWNVAEDAFKHADISYAKKMDDEEEDFIQLHRPSDLPSLHLKQDEGFRFAVFKRTTSGGSTHDRFTLQVTPSNADLGETCNIAMPLHNGYLGIKNWVVAWGDTVVDGELYHQGFRTWAVSSYSSDMPQMAALALMNVLGIDPSDHVVMNCFSYVLNLLNGGSSFGGIAFSQTTWAMQYGAAITPESHGNFPLKLKIAFRQGIYKKMQRKFRIFIENDAGEALAQSNDFAITEDNLNFVETLYLPFFDGKYYNIMIYEYPNSLWTDGRKFPFSSFDFARPTGSKEDCIIWDKGPDNYGTAEFSIDGKKIKFNDYTSIPKKGDKLKLNIEGDLVVKLGFASSL